MTPAQLHSQVGFYRLPPETTSNKQNNYKRSTGLSVPSHWRKGNSTNHLDAIEEVSDESRASTPAESNTSPKLIRKNTALPGMFERPTRHPSLDDLRGYGRRRGTEGYTSAGDMDQRHFASNDSVVKLPPINNGGSPGNSTGFIDDYLRCSHPQARICQNLRYNLHQLRLRGHEDKLQTIVDSVVVGPTEVETIEIDEILGVRTDEFLKSKFKRNLAAKSSNPLMNNSDRLHHSRQAAAAAEMSNDLPPPADEDDEKRITYDYRYGNPINANKSKSFEYADRRLRMKKYSILMSRPGLRKQFERFARYGEPRASGDYITLSQTEKWFKQSGVIDNWTVTSTDTAIYFKKVSKGSKWLDYDTWRIFLEELSWRKRLNLEYLIEKLELSGKPYIIDTSTVPGAGRR